MERHESFRKGDAVPKWLMDPKPDVPIFFGSDCEVTLAPGGLSATVRCYGPGPAVEMDGFASVHAPSLSIERVGGPPPFTVVGESRLEKAAKEVAYEVEALAVEAAWNDHNDWDGDVDRSGLVKALMALVRLATPGPEADDACSKRLLT